MQQLPFHRRVLLWVFVVMFFALAPAVVFYTAGYRWNPKKGAIERYGTLIVDTRPSGASISLNGTIIDERSPATLKDVAPGTYRITLTADGRHEWEKTLDVRPELVTFVNDIEMWSTAEPSFLAAGSFTDVVSSENGRYLAASESVDDGVNIVLLEISNGSRTEARIETNADDVSLEWGGDSAAVLVRAGEHSWIVTRRDPERAVELPDGFYRWNDGTLIGSLDGEQYLYDVTNDTTQRIDTEPEVHDAEGTYEIISTTNTTGLVLVDRTKEDLQYGLPAGDWYFGPAYNGTLFLQRSGEWIGFDPDEDRPVARRIATVDPLQDVRVDGETYLLSRYEGEVWVMKLGEEPELVVRKSQPITDVAWHRRGNHIFYTTDSDLIVLELDARDHRVETVLASFDEMNGMTVARRIVYLAGVQNGVSGIYALEVE